MPSHPQRIQIIGSSNAGKSTLAKKLSLQLDIPFIELDALNWKPNWQGRNEHEPNEFRRLIREATTSPAWVVAGNYHSFSEELIWPHADTIIWLDLPLPVLSVRLLKRSWTRWRTQELLWGTNREQFWPQLRIWHSDSLLNWLWKTNKKLRTRHLAALAAPRWDHVNFIHLRSTAAVDAFEETFQTTNP